MNFINRVACEPGHVRFILPGMAKGDKNDSGAKKSEGTLAPRIFNRRATFDYFILDRMECGVELVGSEVKSIRLGHVQLGQSFARIRGDEVFMFGCHVDEYEKANQFNHDATRTRKLLLHKREIRRLEQRLKKEQNCTLIPLAMYFKRGFVKVELAIAKGKQAHDKRAAIKEKDDKRAMQRAVRRP